MNTKNKSGKKVVVVANDAGGGEILAAHIKSNPKFNFLPYTAGPASRIFEREGIIHEPASVETIKQNLSRLIDIDLVLTGTGWMTPIERLAIIEAKKLGIKTAAFLDHWVNYRERFGYPEVGWENNLPDEIWVGDEAAEKLAKDFFPGRPIRLVPNPYFASFAERYEKLKETQPEGEGLLFIGEPNNYVEKVLGYLLDYLVAKNFAHPVILRPHPAEGEGRYDAIKAKYDERLVTRTSIDPNVLNDFLSSRLVVGMESAALALALYCGKSTFSFITNPQIICPLPFPELIKIKTAEELNLLDQYLF